MRLFPTHLAIHRSSHTTNFQHETPLDSTTQISMDVPKQEKPCTEHIVLLITIGKHTLVRYEGKQITHRKAIARIKQSVKYRLTLESKREIPVNEGILQQITDAL